MSSEEPRLTIKAIHQQLPIDVTLPRPRSPYKFIINPRLWSLPNFKDLPGLFERIKTNVLYFQTNYLILNFVIFALIIIPCMKTLLTGVVSVIIIGLAVLFFLDHVPHAQQIKQNYPSLVIVGGIALVVVIWNALHTILLLVVALLLPLPLWILHAGLRSTDHLLDGSEDLANTPVGQLMHLFGINP